MSKEGIMKCPQVISATHLRNGDWPETQLTGVCQVSRNWVPSRPLCYGSIFSRFKLAWLVFIGKYDALEWTCQ